MRLRSADKKPIVTPPPTVKQIRKKLKKEDRRETVLNLYLMKLAQGGK